MTEKEGKMETSRDFIIKKSLEWLKEKERSEQEIAEKIADAMICTYDKTVLYHNTEMKKIILEALLK
jgi:hypothetical protein